MQHDTRPAAASDSESRPVTILSGSLGAGKTTLLNHLLSASDREIAVVVNDMGSLNIDAELIDLDGGLVGSDSRVAELSNGCICCNLQGELQATLSKLRQQYDFEALVIEGSGISEPAPIAHQLAEQWPVNQYYTVDTTVTVVDTPRIAATFGAAEEPPERTGPDDSGRLPLADLAIEQIEFCDILVANKRDLVDSETADRVERILRMLQPDADLQWTEFGAIEPDELLGTGRFDAQRVANSAGWKRALAHAEAHENGEDHTHEPTESHSGESGGRDHHKPAKQEDHGPTGHDEHAVDEAHAHLHTPTAYGVDSISYRRRRPFHPGRLEAWLEDNPAGIIRAKGLVWIAERDEEAYTMSLVGDSTRIEVTGRWIASLPPARQQAARGRQSDTDWHPEHGDREQRLALLGTDVDWEQIEADLNGCLVTDAEWDGSLAGFDTEFPNAEGEALTIGSETAHPYS